MYRHIYTYIHITNLCFRPWLSVKVLSNLPLPVYDCVLKGDSVCVCVCVCACMRMCDMRMCERECEWVGGSALCVERCVLSWRCVCVYVCVCMYVCACSLPHGAPHSRIQHHTAWYSHRPLTPHPLRFKETAAPPNTHVHHTLTHTG